MKQRTYVAAVLLALMCLIALPGRATAEVPRMTVDELLAVLDSPDTVVVDVRAEWDWKKTEGMIKNATRLSPNKVGSWMETLDKNKAIVLYCA